MRRQTGKAQDADEVRALTRVRQSVNVARIVLCADGSGASFRGEHRFVHLAIVVAFLVPVIIGCADGSNLPEAALGVEVGRDSAARPDLGIDTHGERDLGVHRDADRGQGDGSDVAGLHDGGVDRPGWDTPFEDDAGEADALVTKAAAEVAASATGTDGAGDGGGFEEGALDAGLAGASFDVATMDMGEDDARGIGSADANDGSASRGDLGAPDAGRVDGPLPRIWVYLMAGQSNMLGQAYVADLAAADTQPIPNAEIYFVSPLETNSHMKAWLPVAPGFGWHDDQFGPEVGFARRYHALYPDRHLSIIKVSQGATELFDLWKAPDGALYRLLAETVLDQMRVLATRGRPEIAGFLWMQGESDGSVREHANAYRDNLLATIQQLRVDLALATMPVVAGLIATDCCWTYADAIRQATTQVSSTVGNMNVVETDDLPMSRREIGHYSAAGQLELGARFANTAATLLGTRWRFPDRLGAVQGDGCFTYAERTGSQATPMTFADAAGTWSGASGASIGKAGMTPGASTQAELAWSAPFAGTFQISVSAALPDQSSTGTLIELSDGSRTIWGPWLMAPGRTIATTLPRDMEQRDRLFFRTSAGPGWDASHDATTWQIEIDTKAVSSFWTPAPM